MARLRTRTDRPGKRDIFTKQPIKRYNNHLLFERFVALLMHRDDAL
jgi:hypothetical protein